MQILKNIKKNTFFLLIITTLILYIVLKDDFINILETLKTIKIRYLLIAVFCFFLSICLKGYVNYLIVNDKSKISFKEAIKHNFIVQFFNGITPFSTGGQPMEIYMLTEHNIPLSKATNFSIQSFIFYQIALVICGLLAVLYNSIFHIFPNETILKYFIILGFLINVIVVVILLAISFSKNTTRKISYLLIKISKMLKLKIDEEEMIHKFEDYSSSFQYLKHKKKLIIVGIILNIISLVSIYIIPLFILFSMNDFSSLTPAETLTSSAYVYIIGAFVPIPGASGGMEYGFSKFFGTFIKGHELAASLLVWRTITYYLGMVIGALLFSIEKKVK